LIRRTDRLRQVFALLDVNRQQSIFALQSEVQQEPVMPL
jgi:hypothetical protein